MTKWEMYWIGVTSGMLLAIIMMLILGTPDSRYKDGQVDALTGKVKYELVVQDDSTRTWESIGE